MLLHQRKIFCLAFLGSLLLSFPGFSAIVTAKPSATTLINSASSKAWYDTSSGSLNLTPSKLVSSFNKTTWYTAYLNYHNSEYPLSSAENVAADSSGNLYICWVNDDDELNLSTNESGEWVVEKIADDVHSCTHISVDSSDNIHMISYSSDMGNYRHITGVSHSWTITNLGEVENVSAPNFAIDSAGTVHMSYLDETNLNLKYATNTSGTLVSETVISISTVMCGSASAKIAIGTSNNPHIAYLDGMSSIKYAAKTGGTWTSESIDTADDCSDLSIAIDSQGYSHIVYTGFNTSGNPIPKYATNKSGSWKKRTLETQLVSPWEYADYDQFSDFSITLDSQKNAHVSYFYTPISGGGRTRAIKYATNENGAFKSYTVADCDTICYYFTKVMVTSSGLSTLSKNTSIPILASSKTTTTPILSSLNQKVAIVYLDYSSSLYNIHYVSTKEITDTCQDFTLTLTDADCDGIDDSEDTDQVDSDGDGTVDSADPDYLDSDNDGTVDSQDAFPDDPTENKDSDGDGIGDNAEVDSDNDGTPNVSDAFPEDATETTDTDEDGIGNNVDTDDDDDGFLDDVDPNPTTFDADTDHDGIPDSTDDDDDGDSTPDSTDADSGEA